MSATISGRDALHALDGALGDLRQALARAIAAADESQAREAEVQDEQLQLYRALAAIRFDVVREADGTEPLDALHLRARDLIDGHAAHVRQEAGAVEAASLRIMTLESERAALARRHDEAIETYEARVAEVEARLLEDPNYKSRVEANAKAAAIAQRAEQKLEVARADREEKGRPYRDDPLFLYLWQRRFRSPDYRAPAPIRMLDSWVARVCGYDQAFLNYQRLTELPERLAEHAGEVRRKANDALAALEAAEIEALRAAGADTLRAAAEALMDTIGETDAEIEAAEAAHQALVQRHESAMRSETGPAVEARNLLADGLRRASFPDLRVLAAETIEAADDRIVDQLVRLRAEQMSLDLEAKRLADMPRHLRRDLGNVEELRRRFKTARFDSPYTLIRSATFDDVLTGLAAGRLSPKSGFDMLKRAVRRRPPRTEPGFGGRRRSETIGLPDDLEDVLWEVASGVGLEIARGVGRGTISLGGLGVGRRSGRPTSFPGGGGKRGGFRTGGGF